MHPGTTLAATLTAAGEVVHVVVVTLLLLTPHSLRLLLHFMQLALCIGVAAPRCQNLCLGGLNILASEFGELLSLLRDALFLLLSLLLHPLSLLLSLLLHPLCLLLVAHGTCLAAEPLEVTISEQMKQLHRRLLARLLIECLECCRDLLTCFRIPMLCSSEGLTSFRAFHTSQLDQRTNERMPSVMLGWHPL